MPSDVHDSCLADERLRCPPLRNNSTDSYAIARPARIVRTRSGTCSCRAIRFLTGVVSVPNSITLEQTDAAAAQVKEKVQAALQRQAASDAKSNHVDIDCGKAFCLISGGRSAVRPARLDDRPRRRGLLRRKPAAWAARPATNIGTDASKCKTSP